MSIGAAPLEGGKINRGTRYDAFTAILFERLEECGYNGKLGGVVAVSLFVTWSYAFYMNLLGNVYTTFTLCICTGIIILIKTSYIVSRISNIKILQILGKASFSIYLWNFPTDMISDLLSRKYDCFNYARVSVWVLHFFLSLGLALLSYFWMEPRLNRSLQSLIDKYI